MYAVALGDHFARLGKHESVLWVSDIMDAAHFPSIKIAADWAECHRIEGFYIQALGADNA
jgi:hypothetical protein